MIEIKELIVKINVNPEPQNGVSPESGSAISKPDKNAIIDECLEQVARILKNQKER